MPDNKTETKKQSAAIYARVKGRVQGVGFRFSTVREAHKIGVNGWVRNASNGDVEVWAESTPDKLEIFLAWLRKGPQFSRIDSVAVEEKAGKGYHDFNVEF